MDKQKKHIFLKSSGILLGSILLFICLNTINDENSASAQDFFCDPEIPIGESFEKALEIANDITDEIQNIQYIASNAIRAAERAVELSMECDINKCQPVCDKVPYDCSWSETICPPMGACYTVNHPKTCYRCETRQCSSQYPSNTPCPKNQIQSEYSKIESFFNQINGSSGRIDAFYQNKNEVKDNLYIARQGFNSCSLSPSEWVDAAEGNKSVKMPLGCVTVLRENFSRKEEECKSLFNFFCCQ